MIEAYFRKIQALLRKTDFSKKPTVEYSRRSREVGFIKGDLFFKDGSRLHFREFVQVKRRQTANRYMYAYHYQNSEAVLIFRYDDTDHFRDLSTAPHHKHIGESDVIASNPPDLAQVLKEIEGLISKL